MPSSLTIFVANHLVFAEAVAAIGAVAFALHTRSRDDAWRWLIASGITGTLAEILTQLGGSLFNDPRPFAVGHFRPLIPHVADNGFPSDHALLAAFLVACVIFARVWRTVLPVAALAILVDWARVGAGIHHPIDVIGSTMFVALGAIIAASLSPFVFDWHSRYLPSAVSGPTVLSPVATSTARCRLWQRRRQQQRRGVSLWFRRL